MERRVRLYALSTCAWCKRTKRFLEAKNIEYENFDVDLLEGDEKAAARAEVAKHNPRISYPTLIINDDEVIIGFDETKLAEAFPAPGTEADTETASGEAASPVR